MKPKLFNTEAVRETPDGRRSVMQGEVTPPPPPRTYVRQIDKELFINNLCRTVSAYIAIQGECQPKCTSYLRTVPNLWGWSFCPNDVGVHLHEAVLSLSYGKDSLACLGAIEQLGWPLDRIVHAEVWGTNSIPADLPPMVEFKKKAGQIIYERWGIRVEHIRPKESYEAHFYRLRTEKSKSHPGLMYGWPIRGGSWCNSDLKMSALNRAC